LLSYQTPLSRSFLLILPALFLLVLAVPGSVLADGGPPKLEKARGEACIRPTEWMRRNHMDFLKHRRAETVREGLRIRSESLQSCVNCHTSREQFCDKCHAYVGVAPGCFECHNYPK